MAHGIEQPRIIMLVPRAFESRLARTVAAALPANVNLQNVHGLHGHYHADNSKLVLEIRAASTAGGQLPLEVSLTL